SGFIKRISANTGTAIVTGILTNSSNLGSLSQTFGSAAKLVVTLPSQTYTDASTFAASGNSGSVINQSAGTSFNISKITAADQFLNIVSSYTGSHTLSYTGPGNPACGSNPSYTTSVTFTSGQASSVPTTLTKAETTT